MSIDEVAKPRRELKATDKRAEEAEDDGSNKGIESGFDELEEFCKVCFPNVPAQMLDLKSLSS